MRKLIFIFLIMAVSISNAQKTKEDTIINNLKMKTFELDSIPKEYSLKSNPQGWTAGGGDKRTLGLPDDFINRDFIANNVGFKDNLNLLVGMVVKREKFLTGYRFRPVQDFKYDTVKLTAKIPSSGLLVEKKYDKSIGFGISYLIASATVDANSAFQFIISDVSEIIIDDKSVNKRDIYDTYNSDSEIADYFLVKAAVTTSIVYKTFSKLNGNAGFNTGAIKVNGKVYSESTDFKQDWKIGLQTIPLKEYLKGYKPATQKP